jgi:hypothetical protein
MFNKLIYFNPLALAEFRNKANSNVEGLDDFLKIQNYFMLSVGIIDRSFTLKNPLNCTVKNPLPTLDNTFSLSYEECIMDRMEQIDKLSLLGKKFRLLYSGGIDSTAIFAAFIDYFGMDRCSNILEICCSPDSIDENPWVWDRYIRRGKFKIISSLDHRNNWKDNVIVVMGEGNDHLFGGLGTGGWNKFMGDENLYHPVNKEIIADFLIWQKKTSQEDAKYVADNLILVANKAPFAIDNMYLFIWWYKFVLDWESVMLRVLALGNMKQFQKHFLDQGFVQFYNTEKLQQWSMHFHKDNPTSYAESKYYKRVCKDFILKKLNIPEYNNKNKYLSWPRVHSLAPAAAMIDETLTLYHDPKFFKDFFHNIIYK